MGPLDLAIHLAGFAAPAVFLALLLPTVARLLLRRSTHGAWWWHATLVLAAGLVALGVGLWYFGRDGKMLSYAGLLIAAAGAQWLAARSWR